MHTFNTTDTAHKYRNGQVCEIVRMITEPDAEHDSEVLPMHVVRFGDGAEIEAYPDELADDPARSDARAELVGILSITERI